MRKILALDLGTMTGFCVGTKESHVSGTWNLKPTRWEGGGMRYVRFRQALDEILKAYTVDAIFYEEVRRHRGTDAAHIYGGLMGHLTQWCEDRSIPYEAVPVGEIKKSWTGKGNANKQAMMDECADRGYVISDDNEADAVALFNAKVET